MRSSSTTGNTRKTTMRFPSALSPAFTPSRGCIPAQGKTLRKRAAAITVSLMLNRNLCAYASRYYIRWRIRLCTRSPRYRDQTGIRTRIFSLISVQKPLAIKSNSSIAVPVNRPVAAS